MQHSCSHSNAFRSIPSQTCTYLRAWQHQMTTVMQPFHCDLQSQIQETHRTMHIDTTTQCRTQRRNQFATETTPAAHELPFIAGCNHFTLKNTRFRAPASSPKQAPRNIHAAILLWCIVMWCQVSHRPSSMSILLWCIVMWRQVSHLPSSMSILLWYIVMWCQVSHLYCYVMSSLTPPFIKVKSFVVYCYVMSGLTPVLLCEAKSHTTLHQGQVFCDVLLCDVKSHTCIVMWCQVSHHPASRSSLSILFVRNTEVLLPNFLWSMIILWVIYIYIEI